MDVAIIVIVAIVAIVAIVVITTAWLPTPIIVAIIGGLVSFIIFWYQRQMARHAALAEAFRMLNQVQHREARKVLYDFHEETSKGCII